MYAGSPEHRPTRRLEDGVIAQRHRAPLRRGFSMIELIVVLTLLSVITAMALGRTSSIMTGFRVTRAAQAFAEELQSGFALVGRNRKPLSFVWDTTNMELRIVDRNNVVYRRRSFGPYSDYKLVSANITPSRSTLEVYPPGLAADSLSVVFAKNGASRRIRMLRGGLVQVCNSGATNAC